MMKKIYKPLLTIE